MGTRENHSAGIMMKQYITKTLYEKEGLLIGSNGISFIVGQNDEWVVLDKRDIKNIHDLMRKTDVAGGLLNGLIIKTKVKGKIVLTQENNTVAIRRSIFNNLFLKK